MHSIWINDDQVQRALERNEVFWRGELERGPLMWVTVADAVPGTPPPDPGTDDELWTDVPYVIEAAEYALSHSRYFGDALPIHNPWLGPDQVAAWLGAEMTLRPRDFTSWVKPFVSDWSQFPNLTINADNPWWKLYLQILRASVERGKNRWVTTYPDLHTGIDGLSAIRGPEKLLVDMLENPEPVRRAMEEMTRVFEWVVDVVSEIVLPSGQGTTNWTAGWSQERFLCIGQNDFTCMISPQMFDEFCLQDTRETTNYVDHSIYHLDGPDAIRHLPRLLEIEKLDCIQWIHGAGQPSATHWLDLLKRIQRAGKSVQVYYGPDHGDDEDTVTELEILCRELDPDRLFFWASVPTVEEASELMKTAAQRSRNRV
jgi:hypothetical protein